MAGGAGEDNPVGINVTAMVDIIFCLCLFFMCSLKFKGLDGKFESWLPGRTGLRPGALAPAPIDELRILLSFDRERREVQRVLGHRPLPAGEAGDRILLDEVGHILTTHVRLGRSGDPPPVIVDSGPAVPWEEVVRHADLCRGAGALGVQFACGSREADR